MAMPDPSRAEGFNRQAREALSWTIVTVPPELVAGLVVLPASMSPCGCRLAHGLPPDNVPTYLHGVGTKAKVTSSNRVGCASNFNYLSQRPLSTLGAG